MLAQECVLRIGVERITPAEDAAQQGVAIMADVLGRLGDLLWGHVQEEQHVRNDRQRSLEDFRHDLGRAGRLQLLETAVIFGAHQHGHIRAQLAHRAHDPERGSQRAATERFSMAAAAPRS